ncbi:MAG: hypothetical protein WAU39_08465 [Polyangiales bacterium]
MLRFASFSPGALVALAIFPGCVGFAVDCDLGSCEPEIQHIAERYALGSRTRIRVLGHGPWTIESNDRSVVRIDAIDRDDVDDGDVTLSFVGVGRATLAIENELATVERTIEVLPHDRFDVVLAEITGAALGPIADQVLLAGRQWILVLYLDAQGRALYGEGLAKLNLSRGVRRCDEVLGAVERHCLWIENPGAHVLEVEVGDERVSLPFQAVLASDVIDVELLAAEERELQPRTWVQVDLVGITRDGMRVRGMHPRFEVGEGSYVGYFAYQYDPSARPLTLLATTLGLPRRIIFRGLPRQKVKPVKLR